MNSSQSPHREETKMEKFEVGNVVQLKSGGPLMTVSAVNMPMLQENEGVELTCDWFTNGRHAREVFPTAALVSSEPTTQG